MIVDWEPLPIFQKNKKETQPLDPNHRPKPPTTSPSQSTKCILDTELYMKVVQKEVANVSNPIARIVPSTVAGESSGTAMRRCFLFFSWTKDQNKPGCLDFLHCYYALGSISWKNGDLQKVAIKTLCFVK